MLRCLFEGQPGPFGRTRRGNSSALLPPTWLQRNTPSLHILPREGSSRYICICTNYALRIYFKL